MKRSYRAIISVIALLLTLCFVCSSCEMPSDFPVDVNESSTAESTNLIPTTAQATTSTASNATKAPTSATTSASPTSATVTAQTTGGDGSGVLDPNGYLDLRKIPAFSDEPFYVVNRHVPFFMEEELTTKAYEYYGDLDALGRCTVAMACVGKELMPTEDRGSISSVKPTGWQSVTYPNVSGGYLYNRCHLIGWQLTGENANRKNLITGTQYLNIEGMLPFENMIADYVKETNNHVLLRVTPIFDENDLVCTGVLMEAYSVEDEGEGIQFNVFCYNSQPGIEIDYATGKSQMAGSTDTTDPAPESPTYIINTSSKKIHSLTSKYQNNLTANMEYTTLSLVELLKQGYTTCGICKPS